jgi:hypothetical protein
MMIDSGKVRFQEKDIEDYLYAHPESIEVLGSKVKRWIKRQLKVPSGIIDLLGITYKGYLIVVELKNVQVDAKAITQVCRYAHDIQQIAEVYDGSNTEIDDNGDGFIPTTHVIKMIVGPSISDCAFTECDACQVLYRQFSVNFSVDFAELQWTRNYFDERNKVFDSLMEDQGLGEAFSEIYQIAKGEIAPF